MSVPAMRIDPESAFCKRMISLSSTLLPLPLFPSTETVSPRWTFRLMPFSTFCSPKDFCSRSTSIGKPFPFLTRSIIGSSINHLDQAHQYYVREDHEQR